MTLATITISDIDTGRRLREISPAQVEALVASIGDIGLLNPITVYRQTQIRGGASVDGYGLVAGAHRLEACRKLGLVDIDANVVELSDLERQIAECDENLCGTILSKAERAMFTKRRKDAYEALHPETKHGGDRASRKVCDLKEADRFTADTAAKTGQSERSVQLDVHRANKISERALSLVKGSKLDSGSYLDKLKSVPKEQQVERVRADLSNQSNLARRVKQASAPLSDIDATEAQIAALMAAWNKAGFDARAEFLSRIGATETLRAAE